MGRTSLYILSIALVAGAGLYQLQFGNNSASTATSDSEKASNSERLRHRDVNDVTPQSAKTDSSSSDYNPPFDPANPPEPLYSKSGTRLITVNELAAHGVNGTLRPLWLAVAGRVYDVEKGAEHYYGEKGGYNFFTGRDGSRAYVTGEFNEEGLTDDLTGLSPLDLTEIENWVKLYDKDYTFVGKLIGRYYNREGKPRKAWYKYRKGLEQADQIKAEQKAQEKKFPPCNSRFTPEEGGTVSCSTMR